MNNHVGISCYRISGLDWTVNQAGCQTGCDGLSVVIHSCLYGGCVSINWNVCFIYYFCVWYLHLLATIDTGVAN